MMPIRDVRTALIAMALLCAPWLGRGATEEPYTYTVAGGEATITGFDTS